VNPSRADELAHSDTSARHAAQQLFDAPLVLEAGAGTGKTTALVARVLAWSLGPGFERATRSLRDEADAAGAAPEPDPGRIAARVLGRVVAITFTEAAAAEMGSRVADALAELERGELPTGLFEVGLPGPEERRARARALRGALDHLGVYTIHAWCRRLLATHPLEAGVHPRLEIDAEGEAAARVVREVLERRLAEAYAAPGHAPLVELALRGHGPLELEAELQGLVESGVSAAALERDPLAPDEVAGLAERLRSALAELHAAAGQGLAQLASHSLGRQIEAALAASLARLDAGLPRTGDALVALVVDLEQRWPENRVGKLREWSRGRLGTGEAKALDGCEERVARAARGLLPLLAHLRDLDLELLELARPALGALLAEVEGELRARGIASFAGLLSGARELLGHPQIAARLRSRIDQLLVDEFQDTDREQCEILRALVLAGPPAERPGLLLVGDPKQSIYGWRSADLAAYHGFVRDVLAAGGRLERLSVNHRSVPAILEEVERVIAPRLVEETGVQAAFQPLVASQDHAGDAGYERGRSAPVEYWIPAQLEDGVPCRTSARRANELEADALARDLRALHDGEGVPWKDFGLLFRSRGDWDIYLRALRRSGIPHSVEGDRSYYRRREIIEAAALVRCVLDPSDRLALLTSLRSAAVGVPDAALLPLFARGLPERMGALYGAHPPALADLREAVAAVARSLPAGVPGLERVAGWERNLLAFAEALGPLRESFERDPGDLFVERLRTLTLFEASEAARTLGAWRSANLERFFRKLAEWLAEGGDVQQRLRALRAALADEEATPEARLEATLGDAVRVLTIHGAKGLAFEHVYLLQLHKGSGTGGSRELRAGEALGRLELRLCGAPTLGFDRLAAERARVTDAERVRTFYVALTRARRRLVVAGLPLQLQSRGATGQLAELLSSRTPPLPDLRALGERLAKQRGEDRCDEALARVVFPALSPGRGETTAGAAAAVRPLSDPRAVEAAAHRLLVLQEAARARMQLRLVGRASGEEQEEWADSARPALGAEIARAVGSAMHRALEELDLGAEPAAELARQQALLPGRLQLLLGTGPALEAALRQASGLLEAFARGPLGQRLRALAGQVLARELPLLLCDLPEGGLAATSLAGSIDLLYLDPATRELVVADYKTERVDPGEDLAARARRHAVQGRAYQRAVAEAFGLAAPPRFELWFLAAGRVEALSPELRPGAGPEA
jgi:ATP-dependent helicase/nuclease subunit A